MRILKAFILSSLGAVPGLVLFIVLFWLGIWATQIPILMYRGLALALIAGFLHTIILMALLNGRPGIESIVIASVSLAFAINVIFLVVVPVTIDRSVSVYLLGQLSMSPEGLTEAQLNHRLINQYVGEFRAVDRRMREQITSGNVRVVRDRYLLTDQGQHFIDFSFRATHIFGIDPRYLNSNGSFDADEIVQGRN
jgi:hypothetical protein